MPGSKLIQADALSRRPDYIDENDDNDEEYYILIPLEWIISKLMTEYNDRIMEKHIWLVLNDLEGQIIEATWKDPFTKRIEESLQQKKTPFKSKLSDWTYGYNIKYQGWTYIPQDNELRHEIIWLYHDLPHAGHPGKFKMQELIKQDYWWPNMATMIKKWIEGCAICQQMKINTHPTNLGLQLIKSNTTKTIWTNHSWFYYWSTACPRLWFSYGCGWPWT